MLRPLRTPSRRAARAALALFCTLGASGCGSCGGVSGSVWTDDGSPVEPPAFGRLRTHLDLLELRHLADVDHDGLYVDFGTPARMKYTIGNWRTGFGQDQSDGATTFTPVAADAARIYFPVAHVSALTLRLRARAASATSIRPYLNDTPLAPLRLAPGDQFRDYDVSVPASAVVRGENYLLVRHGGGGASGATALAVALDSLRVISGATDPEEAFDPPEYGSLLARPKIGGARRRALAVTVPTTLSWYFEVPRGGRLGLGVGGDGDSSAPTTARVVITPEGGPSQEIFSRTVSERWQDATLPLGRWAGQVVRLDLRAEGRVRGRSRVAWSTPTVLVPPPAGSRAAVRAKNVVVLLIDTIRADHVRAFDERSPVQTPAIDRLAREGAVFTSAQATESWTKPSATSILTGLWPMTHGVKTGDSLVPAGATLLSEMLRGAGFQTAAFIASTLLTERHGYDRGWSSFRNFSTENLPTEAEPVLRDAGDWIEQHARERFFVYVHTIDPHVPYDPPGQYARMYDEREYAGRVQPSLTPRLVESLQRDWDTGTNALDASDLRRLVALYDGEISYHDHHLGELLARLERIGVLDDTIFVVVGDHGEELADHGSYGHGHTVYQELLHVPLVVRFPGTIAGGQRIDTAVSAMDLLPTVLDAVGVAVPGTVEAQSLFGLARGEPPAGPAVAFSELQEEHRVVRAGRWKLALRGVTPTLFDLARDPHEQHPLPAGSRPIALRYCRILLGQFLGARNRREWLGASPSGPGLVLERESVTSDAEQCRRLAALGYATTGCPPLTRAPPPTTP